MKMDIVEERSVGLNLLLFVNTKCDCLFKYQILIGIFLYYYKGILLYSAVSCGFNSFVAKNFTALFEFMKIAI